MKIINLGTQSYLTVWKNMQDFTTERDDNTEDELWTVQHHSVFTQGISSKEKHILKKTDIPIINTDRGGQTTYHGPGQLVIYLLCDLKKLGIGIKKIVQIIELSMIDLLAKYNIKAHLKEGSHGVYVNDAKIGALGLKVKNYKTYHGLSLNVDMDLSPFGQINPCGYKDLKVTQMSDLTNKTLSLKEVGNKLGKILCSKLKLKN